MYQLPDCVLSGVAHFILVKALVLPQSGTNSSCAVTSNRKDLEQGRQTVSHFKNQSNGYTEFLFVLFSVLFLFPG